MYLSFYGLTKRPFHLTPDPEFLYPSRSHKETLAAMLHAIGERDGIVAITGAVGVGKTTILRSYLEAAKKERLKVAYIFNPKLTFEGLLKTIFRELNLPVRGDGAAGMVNRLHEFLIEEYTRDNTVVLVVDEAQNMPVDTLESLCLISNLETSRDKLIQVVLVGQPELEEELNLDRLRRLKQRLSVRSTILPLTKAESLDYIKFRLQKAGASSPAVFTTPALKEIVRKGQGIPRVLNVLCDNALITGFGYQKKPVTKRAVQEVIADFENEGRPRHVQWHLACATALALLALFVAITWFVPLKPVLFDRMETSLSRGQILQDDAIRAVRPATYDDRVREAPSTGEASPPGNEPAAMKTVMKGDFPSLWVKDAYGFVGGAPPKMGLDPVRRNDPPARSIDEKGAGEAIAFLGR